jgi:hypothetical protein
MTLQAVDGARYVRVGGTPMLVICYEPETGDVVVVVPTDHSLDPANPGLLGTGQVRRRHSKGEYQPDDDPQTWATNGPCVDLPN